MCHVKTTKRLAWDKVVEDSSFWKDAVSMGKYLLKVTFKNNVLLLEYVRMRLVLSFNALF
jgi:hypothetical protein